MKHLLLLFLFPLSITLSAQDTLSAEYVDIPPQIKSEDIQNAPESADQNDLFLQGVYNSIRYPVYASEYGVSTVVSVTYLVDAAGKVSIEKTSVFTPETAMKLGVPKEELITMTSKIICRLRSFGSPPIPASPSPSQAIIEQRRAKANAMLEAAAAASISALPDFIPGRHHGETVVTRSTRFFSFQPL